MDLDEASLLNAEPGDPRGALVATKISSSYAGIWDGAKGHAEKRSGPLLLQSR